MAKDLIDDGKEIGRLQFNYDTLSPELAAIAREAAGRVRGAHGMQVEAIVEIGRELARIKELMEHGTFLQWIQAECRFAARTAQNYMQVWGAIGDKYETVSHLKPVTIYKIAARSTPEEARRAILGSGPDLSDSAALNVIRQSRLEQQDTINILKREQLLRRGKAKRISITKAHPQVRQAVAARVAERVRMTIRGSRAKVHAAKLIAELAGGHRARVIEALYEAGYRDLAIDVGLVPQTELESA